MKILITGGAGFIGSHLADELIKHPDISAVRLLDNLATGSIKNITHLLNHEKITFLNGDIRDYETCLQASEGMDLISHQAALGSVPRSIKDPRTTNDVNISGALNVYTAAKENSIRRVVYAASSSTYGDHPGLPKREVHIGRPLSPYAVTKYVNELYAQVFASVYQMEFIGLRYFNVFGPRQTPDGPYAAVIPLFMRAILNNEPPVINGDGSHSRDFTFVKNAVQANVKALFTTNPEAVNQVYNIAFGQQTTLLEVFEYMKEVAGSDLSPRLGPERAGDVRHSLADITKARELLGYDPEFSVKQGIKTAFDWYREHHHFGIS
ncbi:MAG TPA: SDR family oxidoreductase [Flavisolibacter sp.]|jgi:UDP-N-acetylglucosamine 4-epimerase|nr:SDR family oxidoreductase [Flavisolibacter sp.]